MAVCLRVLRGLKEGQRNSADIVIHFPLFLILLNYISYQFMHYSYINGHISLEKDSFKLYFLLIYALFIY